MSFFASWLLTIMISTCPCTGDWAKDNTLILHMVMKGEGHCMSEADRIMSTWLTFHESHPNLKIEVMCRPDQLNQTYGTNN